MVEGETLLRNARRGWRRRSIAPAIRRPTETAFRGVEPGHPRGTGVGIAGNEPWRAPAQSRSCKRGDSPPAGSTRRREMKGILLWLIGIPIPIIILIYLLF